MPVEGAVNRPAPYFVSLRLIGKKVLVVGGGEIGTGKVETLLGSKPRLVVVDPSPSDRVRDLARHGRLELRERRFCPMDVFGSALVVAATGDSKTNRWIRLCARMTRALVNAVDDPENCDVTVPAVVNRGPATIAISTNGASPAAARFLREELSAAVDAVLPPESGHVLQSASETRNRLRAEGSYRFDYHGWRTAFFEPAFEALRVGKLGDLPKIADNFIEHERNKRGPQRAGSVALVGAGPGGDLITLPGLRALASADVVLYDRLVDGSLLSHAPVAAERIPVGKGRGFGHSQQEICELMITRAKRGQRVIRLKGGDPFVFGRGGEEMSELSDAGIEVEVVPGVSSAFAAAALAGIPVTDRRCASAVTVVTGHEAARLPKDAAALDGTVVVLMAASTAADVASRLIQLGRPTNEPVALVHQAGSPAQSVHVVDLATVRKTGCPFPSPTVMIVGEVVRLRPGGDQSDVDLTHELFDSLKHHDAAVAPVR